MPATGPLLRTMLEQGGSHLHLTVGLPPKSRTSGALKPIGSATLDMPTMENC